MDKMEVERIIKLGMDTYNHIPWCDEIKDCLTEDIDKQALIVGLIYEVYTNGVCVESYKQSTKQLNKEIGQLNERIDSLKEENSLLKKENKQLSIKVENSMKKNISYRADVDTMAIHSLLEKNYSKSEIAERLGVSRQTIYRRLKENK